MPGPRLVCIGCVRRDVREHARAVTPGAARPPRQTLICGVLQGGLLFEGHQGPAWGACERRQGSAGRLCLSPHVPAPRIAPRPALRVRLARLRRPGARAGSAERPPLLAGLWEQRRAPLTAGVPCVGAANADRADWQPTGGQARGRGRPAGEGSGWRGGRFGRTIELHWTMIDGFSSPGKEHEGPQVEPGWTVRPLSEWPPPAPPCTLAETYTAIGDQRGVAAARWSRKGTLPPPPSGTARPAAVGSSARGGRWMRKGWWIARSAARPAPGAQPPAAAAVLMPGMLRPWGCRMPAQRLVIAHDGSLQGSPRVVSPMPRGAVEGILVAQSCKVAGGQPD